ncbi:MAG: YecA family protein [Myxococcota bacterium]
MSKLGPNDRCPCGSGLKFKKCCGGAGAGRCSPDDRVGAMDRLASVADDLDPEGARAAFWSEIDGSPEDLGERGAESEACFEAWLYFDRLVRGGRTAVDLALEDPRVPPGERAWLTSMRGTGIRLYEIVEVRPGSAITLRDVLDGGRVTVNERSFSRQAVLRDWIAARVNPLGPSGGPELEFGVLGIAGLGREALRDELSRRRRAFAGDARVFAKTTAPVIHAHWVRSLLDPPIPTLTNTDGERMAETRVTFEVLDEAALRGALPRAAGVAADEEEDGRWFWNRDDTVLGTLRLRGSRLVLEVNSPGRGHRGRALIEGAAGAAVRHVSTVSEDVERKVREALRAQLRGETSPVSEPESDIPADMREQLVLDHYARHYRKWVDEPIPRLDGRTPREAARDGRLRPRVVEMLHELEGFYAAALKKGEPAYDASWMWADLGLDDDVEAGHPLPLAHERLAELVPGALEACRGVAVRVRGRPGFDDRATVVDDADLAEDLDVQRLLGDRPDIEPLLRAVADHELHRRKTFWVSGDLAWTLSHTDLDVPGDALRAPFPSFAVVFTDRLVLSLAERWLARDRSCPLAGHVLRIATVYVTEPERGMLRVGVAVDALGVDVPPMREVTLSLGTNLAVALEGQPAAFRDLLAVVLQAILYATSVGVEPVVRRPPAPSGEGKRRTAKVSSEEVFYLPGSIDVSRLRSVRALERTSEGRALLHRFLVRGHWRRPASGWKDQRMRWIAPYWKGPEAAAVIEKAYRLLP